MVMSDLDDGYLSGGGCCYVGLWFGWLCYWFLLWYGCCFLFVGYVIDDQLIGDVIFIDIVDVGYCFGVNFFCCYIFDVIELDVWVKFLLFSYGVQVGDMCWICVIGGKGKQCFIELGYGFIGIVLIYYLVYVFYVGMDIGIQLFNIVYFQFFFSVGYYLYNVDGVDVVLY